MLQDHLIDLTNKESGNRNQIIEEARAIMAKRIFANHLKFDIICLQEADYLNPSMFPENYEVLFGKNTHSVNGIAWNKERFELVETIGELMDRIYLVKLQDKHNGKTVLVASGHLSGCNPYRVEKGDSTKGDHELKAILDLFDENDADFKVIGMDSNVTSLHPRLNILKEANFKIDYENHLESTCTNPHQVLNTRIDWITVKEGNIPVSITNIPVLGVGLNSMQTNISDHKPVAAKIQY
jgi:endonuclease/exonuclease/phosphatase family metal-dependent hydrolase